VCCLKQKVEFCAKLISRSHFGISGCSSLKLAHSFGKYFVIRNSEFTSYSFRHRYSIWLRNLLCFRTFHHLDSKAAYLCPFTWTVEPLLCLGLVSIVFQARLYLDSSQEQSSTHLVWLVGSRLHLRCFYLECPFSEPCCSPESLASNFPSYFLLRLLRTPH